MSRTSVIALALVLVGSAAHADEPLKLDLAPRPVTSTPSLVSNELARAAESARDAHDNVIAMRNVGITLSVVGTVATIAGSVLFVHNTCIDDCANSGPDTTPLGERVTF